MITIRKSNERGHIKHDWFDTYHTFSFGDYLDPQHTHFQTLRVINEDLIKPSTGFPFHSHQDMEIITYIISGAIEHQDSLGNKGQIRKGEIQFMRAGSGITHSEANPSAVEETHLLQIWIFPNQKNLEPKYQQKQINLHSKPNQLLLIASPNGENNSFEIYQDAKVYACILQNKEIQYNISRSRSAWLQIVAGNLSINSTTVSSGDGIAIRDETQLKISGDGEFILFDLE
jgi:quercetin 2,3-dioxygenase